MKVILREDVDNVGTAGQTVEVRDGYGRNFLLPRNLAIPATQANLKSIGEIERQRDVRDRKRRKAAEIVKDRIEKINLQTEVLVGEEDRMFGSVTPHDITDMLSKHGVTIDRRMIELDEPIKALGMYTVPIKIDKQVTANLKLLVVKKTPYENA